jgi:SAM-dependent methyltransferase
MNKTTINYYDNNAAAFFEQTVNVDMSPLYEKFLAYLPKNGHILDAGCGSGRDAKAFLELGFDVTAFDASAALAARASEFIGQPVRCCRFDEITEVSCFDGVWACASLLHVDDSGLLDAISGLVSSLRFGGAFYASFKNGIGERTDANGRHFTDMTLEKLQHLVDRTNGLVLLEAWETQDQRPGRKQESWWNVIGRKC